MVIGERLSGRLFGKTCQQLRDPTDYSDRQFPAGSLDRLGLLNSFLSEWEITRQDLQSNDEGAPAIETKKAIERISLSEENFSILCDFDETLANVRPPYVFVYLQLMDFLEPFHHDLDKIFYEYLEKGRGSYFFRETFGIAPEEFDEIHHVLLQSLVVNRNLQQLPDTEHQAMMEFMERNADVVGAVLTTRPATVTAMQASREVFQDIFKQIVNFQNVPIIAREEEKFKMSETNECKFFKLKEIAKVTGKAMILIDDNDSMREVVSEYNQLRVAGMPPIVLIIYKNAEYHDKDWSENAELGVYASDWQKMDVTLSRVRADWKL